MTLDHQYQHLVAEGNTSAIELIEKAEQQGFEDAHTKLQQIADTKDDIEDWVQRMVGVVNDYYTVKEECRPVFDAVIAAGEPYSSGLQFRSALAGLGKNELIEFIRRLMIATEQL
jgi:hypothetical protein